MCCQKIVNILYPQDQWPNAIYSIEHIAMAKLCSYLKLFMTFSPWQSYFYSLQMKSDTPDLLLKPKVDIEEGGSVPNMKEGEAVLYFRIKKSKECK